MPKFPKFSKMSVKQKCLGVFFVAVAAIAFAVGFEQAAKPDTSKMTATQLMAAKTSQWSKAEKPGSVYLEDLRTGNVKAVGIGATALLVTTADDSKYYVTDARGALAATTIDTAKATEAGKGFELAVLPKLDVGSAADGIGATIREYLHLIVSVGLLLFLYVSLRGELGGGSKLLTEVPAITFDDVIGGGEAKAALKDVVQFMRNPAHFAEIGARPPRGVLMLGGPGVGKTLLAKALAGEGRAKFIATNGSNFSSKYYGVGIQKVKQLFKIARENAPCIIFVDEIDGCSARGEPQTSADAESNRIINAMLVEMDGFGDNEGIIVVGATNLPQNMDPALLRPGRFDRKVTVGMPDVRDRQAIFELYAGKLKKVSPNIDFGKFARLTIGMSPAEIEQVVNQAATFAANEAKPFVDDECLMEAIETVRIGAVNEGMRIGNEKTRHRIGVHESGHALMSAITGKGLVEKVTILPRGPALGVTLVTEKEDESLVTEDDLRNNIIMLLGGRMAELEVFNNVSTGASQDLEQASKIALGMVTKFGMSGTGKLFSYAALSQAQQMQAAAAAQEQAEEILQKLNERCKSLMQKYRPELDKLTEKLLEQETVEGEYVYELVRGKLPKQAAA